MSARSAVIGLSVLPVAAALMAFSIEAQLMPNNPETGVDPLYRLLGSAKEGMGDMVFLKADEYFHGGLQFELVKYVKEEGGEEHGAHDESLSHFIGKDWIAEINSRVGVTQHRHLEGEISKEALPLLYTATALNPHNVTAALTTSYWMETEYRDFDKAMQILEKAALKNPGAWEIELRLGELASKKQNNPALAAAHLEKALLSMNETNSMRTDRRLALYLLGESYEAQGMKDKALERYRQALPLFGAEENLFIQNEVDRKIKALENTA